MEPSSSAAAENHGPEGATALLRHGIAPDDGYTLMFAALQPATASASLLLRLPAHGTRAGATRLGSGKADHLTSLTVS